MEKQTLDMFESIKEHRDLTQYMGSDVADDQTGGLYPSNEQPLSLQDTVT